MLALRDDESEVRQAVEECAAAVGSANIDLSAVTDVLLPVLRGEVGRRREPKITVQFVARSLTPPAKLGSGTYRVYVCVFCC